MSSTFYIKSSQEFGQIRAFFFFSSLLLRSLDYLIMGQCNTFEATATKLPRSDRQTDNAKLEASAGSIPALLSDDDEASKEIIYLDGIPLFMLAAL